MAQEKKFTDDKIIEAYEKCSKHPFIPAAFIADVLGANPKYMTDVLSEMVRDEKMEVKKSGNTFFFRPVSK